jgi:hypothetical protein
MNYCPQSAFEYNCSQYQQYVWNAPSLANSPSQEQSTDPICVVYLPGTGGNAYQSIKGLLSSISLLDLHVISLSYLSTSYSVLEMNRLCGDVKYNSNVDVSTCINQLHATIVHGSESSSIWRIHPSDSVSHRLLSTLQSLARSDPSWNQFLSSSDTHLSSVRWDRIIIAGHSQGAGHAGYIASSHLTSGAVLLSGIQDCCSYSTYMNWNLSPWLTPSSRLSILFHSYEDLRGLIVANTDQYLPGQAPVEYTPSSSSHSALQSQYLSVKEPVQNSSACRSSSRPEHSSTATDSCSPLDPHTQPTGYLYQPLWQYLFSRIRQSQQSPGERGG